MCLFWSESVDETLNLDQFLQQKHTKMIILSSHWSDVSDIKGENPRFPPFVSLEGADDVTDDVI